MGVLGNNVVDFGGGRIGNLNNTCSLALSRAGYGWRPPVVVMHEHRLTMDTM
jgi:hypothetical protein